MTLTPTPIDAASASSTTGHDAVSKAPVGAAPGGREATEAAPMKAPLVPPITSVAAASVAAPIDTVASLEDLAALTRPDFPLLSQIACLGQPLIYLDYAATSQKPRQVLEALQHLSLIHISEPTRPY